MWMFLSRALRRWVIAAVLVPLGAKALGAAGRGLERRSGRTRLTRGVQGAADLLGRQRRRGRR
ncbi:hypothetical protein Cma02nite_13190 [Cellulomonas marina]|uniref:Uncharacterized protein n=2 Tax=Cellulomonas marina TaxID=988821 RepID=A0A1I0YHG8_9CELL|nr:hypothetical protein Cma02nite_13190 [Cellulomonas marina]SFB11940.1 hypothetical protein SAMN05421867_107125 [Cellulomonas marina]